MPVGSTVTKPAKSGGVTLKSVPGDGDRTDGDDGITGTLNVNLGGGIA